MIGAGHKWKMCEHLPADSQAEQARHYHCDCRPTTADRLTWHCHLLGCAQRCCMVVKVLCVVAGPDWLVSARCADCITPINAPEGHWFQSALFMHQRLLIFPAHSYFKSTGVSRRLGSCGAFFPVYHCLAWAMLEAIQTMNAITPLNPLSDINERQLESLYAALWKWQSCPKCTKTTSCGSANCATHKAERLGPFKAFYKLTTAPYLPEFAASGEAALRDHDDLIDIINYVRERPESQREGLTSRFFADRAKREGRQECPHRSDQDRAFNMAVRILTMVSCSAENQAGALLEAGIQPITWTNGDSLASFINKSFPTTDHPSLNDPSPTGKGINLKASLEGKRLTSVGLSFQATDNLANHLHLDAEKGHVQIFHHTRVLKEYLSSTQRQDGSDQ